MNRIRTNNSGIRKTHYDAKHAIHLQVDPSLESTRSGMSVANAVDANFKIDPQYDTNYTDAFQANALSGNDEGFDFSEDLDETPFVMAKAYDFDAKPHENAPKNESFASAKAYEDSSVPQDATNEYSDVFESDDTLDFEKAEQEPNPQPPAKELAVADELDVDDDFAKDLHAVLSGQKSLAELADYSDTPKATAPEERAPEDSQDLAVKKLEEKMKKDEAIFDQLAADRNKLTTYQLGAVELGSIFDEADATLEDNKIALAKNRVEDIVDEKSMAMDGMEWAEDFELMESIAEEDQESSEPSPTAAKQNTGIQDAEVTEEITIDPNENKVAES